LISTIPTFDPYIQSLLELVQQLTAKQTNVYLVGGALRDHLLGHEIHDLDFVTDGDTTALSKAVKRSLKGRAFILDDTRQTARVLSQTSEGKIIHLDFVKFTGSNLCEDLENRDFTINAMALSLTKMDQLLDPFGGKDDLDQKILRTCSTQSLSNDPLRVLRGIRLALTYGLNIAEQTQFQMQSGARELSKISAERLRDELFNILTIGKPIQALLMLDRFNCIQNTLPELESLKEIPASDPHVNNLWDHTLHTTAYLDKILNAIFCNDPEIISFLPESSMFVESIWPYQQQLQQHLKNMGQGDRSLKPLLLIAALYHDIGKQKTAQMGLDRRLHFYGHAKFSQQAVTKRGVTLALSNREIEILSIMTAHHMRIHDLANTKKLPSAKAMYRFFKDSQDCSIPLCLLSLADTLATYEQTLPQELWRHELNVVTLLFDAFFNKAEEVVKPVKLVDGNDLINNFGLKPGPDFAKILEMVLEEQVEGNISNRMDALAFIEKYLKDNQEK